jgi:hypothetical protein
MDDPMQDRQSTDFFDKCHNQLTSFCRFLSCSEAVEVMGSYLGEMLPEWSQRALLSHLRGCPICHEKFLAMEIYFHLATSRRTSDEVVQILQVAVHPSHPRSVREGDPPS